jgi:hypothetical protein
VARHRMAAAVAAGLLASLLPIVAAPAQAAQPQVQLEAINNVQLQVGGGNQNLEIRIRNQDPAVPAQNVTFAVTVPLTEFGVNIASVPGGCRAQSNNSFMECTIATIGGGQTASVVAQLGVPGNSPVPAGESRNGTGQVSLTGNFQGTTSFNVRLQGPDRPEGVPEVSGVVRDELTADPIGGAQVILADSQGATYQTTTNDNGEFRFGGPDQPIAPGTIGLKPSKDGYEEGQNFTFQANEGEALRDRPLTLRNSASPTPTATPPQTPTATATASAPAVAPAASSDSGGPSFFTVVMLILGGLLVLAGVGAMVWMWYRRRKERREDEGPEGADSPTSGPRGPMPTPGSRGVYHPTPTQAMGAAPTQVLGGGQTQVLGAGGRPLPAVGPRPGLADATTMMHGRGPAADETAMLPRAGSPGVPHAGDPTSATRPVGPRPPLPGTPPPPRPPAPTYGTPSPYEDTRGYGGSQPTQAYGSPSGRHASPAPSSHDSGGYDRGPRDRGSYDGGAYGPDPYTQPSAGHRPGAGYDGYQQPQPPPPAPRDQRGYGDRYDQGYRDTRYDRGDGYQAPEYDDGHQQRPAYDQAYDQPTYRRPSPSPEPRSYNDYPYDEPTNSRPRHADPPDRRRLDWLDDS